MPAFFEYLRNITYYLLFSTLAGMAAPSGKYKKYVSLITGLVLLLLMAQPLKNLAGQGVPVTEWFAGITGSLPAGSRSNSLTTEAFAASEAEYSKWSYAQVQAEFEAQLYAQVEGLLSREGYRLQSAEFKYEDDFSKITGMDLTAALPKEGVSRPIIRIEPVFIGRRASAEAEAEDENITAIKKVVSDFYAPDAPHINVTISE